MSNGTGRVPLTIGRSYHLSVVTTCLKERSCKGEREFAVVRRLSRQQIPLPAVRKVGNTVRIETGDLLFIPKLDQPT